MYDSVKTVVKHKYLDSFVIDFQLLVTLRQKYCNDQTQCQTKNNL